MPIALITRPREDAQGIGAALQARGFTVRVEPMLDIHILRGQSLALDGVQGFLATSANGVRALATNGAPRDLPVWAVGDATARCAVELGFSTVESAGGDVDSLATLVTSRLPPCTLLHAAGSVVAGDLAGRLGGAGFTVRRQMLYQAQPAQTLSAELLAELDTGRITVALFFSPRTAASFATLARAAGRAEACRPIAAYALSPAVARELAELPWKTVRAAARPEQDSLLAAIDQEGIA